MVGVSGDSVGLRQIARDGWMCKAHVYLRDEGKWMKFAPHCLLEKDGLIFESIHSEIKGDNSE